MEGRVGALAEQAWARGKPLGLMMLDIDFFKAINDTYGHDAGDDVLREFAVRVRKSIRGIDLACRYGGGEFFIRRAETHPPRAGQGAGRLRPSLADETLPLSQNAQNHHAHRS